MGYPIIDEKTKLATVKVVSEAQVRCILRLKFAWRETIISGGIPVDVKTGEVGVG